MAEPRTARWAPVIVVPVVLSLIVVLGTMVALIARSTLPSDGGGHVDGEVFDPLGLQVNPPDPSATVLRRGMVVERIGDVPVDDLLAGVVVDGRHQVGDDVDYRVLEQGRVRDVTVRLAEPRVGRSLGGVALPLSVGVVIAVLGAYVLIRRPREQAAAAFFAFGSCFLASIIGSVVTLEPADLAFRPWLWWTAFFLVVLTFSVMIGSLAQFLLVFPRPPGLLSRRPSLVLLAYAATLLPAGVAAVVLISTGHATTRSFTTLNTLAPLPGLLFLLAGVVNLVTNLVHARRDRTLRTELAIVGSGTLITVLSLTALNVGIDAFDVVAPEPVFLAALLPLPLALAYAVLRRGLFDVRAIVNRTVVYLVVTISLVAAYAAGVVAVQALLQVSELSAAIPLAALVAIAFAPLRVRTQRLVDRITYGRRDEPYAVLAEVSRGIQASSHPADALQQLVDAVAVALRLPHTAIRLGDDQTAEPIAVHGSPNGDEHTVTMIHQGLRLGTLEASARSPGEPLNDADRRLLDDVAAQAAVAADALRLTSSLARSRQRALTAAEDERQRIRRDLHDGLGPALTAISLQLTAALDRAPAGDTLVASLQQANRAATGAKAEIRRIIDGMAPTQLDRLGLMAALHALGDQLNADPDTGTPGHPTITVCGPATLEAVAPEVEVGAYRIAAEAMLNAHRHSGGCHCNVDVHVAAGKLHLRIDDDGVGFVPNGQTTSRVGLGSMHARADALGGELCVTRLTDGTTVTATIPVPGPENESDDA